MADEEAEIWERRPLHIVRVAPRAPPAHPPVDPRLPQPAFLWALIGRPGSGKSTLICNLLSRRELLGQYFDRVHLWSPTAADDPAWECLEFDKTRVHVQYTPAEWARSEQEIRRDARAGLRSLVILDDFAGDGSLYQQNMGSPPMRFALRARHALTSMLFATQSYLLLPRRLRGLCTAYSFFDGLSAREVGSVEEEMVDLPARAFPALLAAATGTPHSFLQATRRPNGRWVWSRGFSALLNPAEV